MTYGFEVQDGGRSMTLFRYRSSPNEPTVAVASLTGVLDPPFAGVPKFWEERPEGMPDVTVDDPVSAVCKAWKCLSVKKPQADAAAGPPKMCPQNCPFTRDTPRRACFNQ